MDAQNYIEEIKELLTAFVKDAHDQKIKGDANWTYEIKKRLGELGLSKGYDVCASGFRDYFEAEWLYDLVWYIEEGKDDNRRLIDIPLVVESEWNMRPDYIRYDFEKLLAANAELKLMICYVHEDNREKMLTYFIDSVAKYLRGREGDTFLIAILDYDTETFSYEVIQR